MLRSRLNQYSEVEVSLVENSIGEVDEASGVALLEGPSVGGIVPPPIPDRRSPVTNRYSYRQAIYSRTMLNGDADIGWWVSDIWGILRMPIIMQDDL